MKLSDYLNRHGSQSALARGIGAQPQLIWQWARGVRPIPISRCRPIEQFTAGAVSRRDLRPGDWQEIWPELASDTPITTTEPATAGD